MKKLEIEFEQVVKQYKNTIYTVCFMEIAAIVGISVKNVSVRLFRIKEELKKMSNN